MPAATVEAPTTAAVEATSAAMEAATTEAATVEAASAHAAMEAASAHDAMEATSDGAAAEATHAVVGAGKSVAVIAAHVSAAEAVIGMGNRGAAIPYATMAVSVTVTVSIAMAISMTPAVPVVAAVPVAVTPVSVTPVAVIPGAGANEDATDEPAGAVVAVRRAGIGIVAVIPIRTNRSRAVSVPVIIRGVIVLAIVARIPNPYADGHLRLSARCQRQWSRHENQRNEPSKEPFHFTSPSGLSSANCTAVVVRWISVDTNHQ
jgi:hypothetical protein